MKTSNVHMVTSVTCSHCGSDLEYVEGWTCPECVIWWDGDPFDEDARAMFQDDDDEVCGATAVRQRSDVSAARDIRYRAYYKPCDLPKGHVISIMGHHNDYYVIFCKESS